MTPISFRPSALRTSITPNTRLAQATTRVLRASPEAPGAAPSAPAPSEVETALRALVETARQSFAAVLRAGDTQVTPPDVVMERAITSGRFVGATGGTAAASSPASSTSKGKNAGGAAGTPSAGTAATSSTPGQSILDTKLANQSSLASVAVGTITINGQSLRINPSRDTLSDVIATLDGFQGVRARVDRTSGLISITSQTPGEDLAISDTSGLLGALGIARGAVEAKPEPRAVAPTPTGTAAASAVNSLVKRVNGVLDLLARSADATPELRTDVVNAVRSAVSAAAPGVLSLGSRDGVATVAVDTRALKAVLMKDAHALDEFVVGPHGLAQGLGVVLASRQSAPPVPPPRPRAPARSVTSVRGVGRFA